MAAPVATERALQPWWRKGLRFECRRCGACCRGATGYVWVSDTEVRRIASDIGLALDVFAREYLRRAGNRLSLVERADGDCVFYRNGCGIYGVRPTQCRAFPFWPANLHTPEAWRRAASACPGTDTGPRHSFKRVARALRSCAL